ASLLICSSSYHTVHPALPPFPTRRSSDLSETTQVWLYTVDTDARDLRTDRPWTVAPVSITAFLAVETTAAYGSGTVTRRCDYLRSEEHTSELQSRFDLVCRLLLEKKKK